MSIKKILIAYHANCADGIGAAHAVTKALTDPAKWGILPERLDYLAMRYTDGSYEELIKKIASDEYCELFVVDFSLPVITLDDILNITPPLDNIYIMDHHKTAYEMYKTAFPNIIPDWDWYLNKSTHNDGATNLEIVLDLSECGTTLVHKELSDHRYNEYYIPILYLYIKDRDLWQKKLHGTEEINQVLKEWVLSISPVHIKEQLAAMDKLMLAMEEALPKVIEEGKELLERYKVQVQKYANGYGILGSKPDTPRARNVLYAQCPPEYASDVGNILAEKQGYYSVTYSLADPAKDGETYKFSLRSVDRPDGSYVDVSILARLFGGGGHAKAAGFYANDIYRALHSLQDIDVSCHMILGMKEKQEISNGQH